MSLAWSLTEGVGVGFDAEAEEEAEMVGMPQTEPAKCAAVKGVVGAVGVTGTGFGIGLWIDAAPNALAEGSVLAINDTTLIVFPRPIYTQAR